MAVTRAKRHVAVVCDAECCGSDAFIGRLLRHIEDRGEYRSALELDIQPDGGIVEEIPATAVGGGGTVDMAAAAAARGSGSGRGSPTGGGRDGRAKTEKGGAEQNFLDEDVLKRVHEFAQREVSKKETGAEAGKLEEELPSQLSARQRALVHETAERLGLGHVSRGEGPRRAVVLSKVKGGGDCAGTVVGEREGEPSDLVVDDYSSTSTSQATRAVGDSLFSALTGDEEEQEEYGSEETKDDGDDGDDEDDNDGDAARATQAAEAHTPTTAKTEASAGRGAQAPNSLLAALHAERAARRPAPPSPPPPQAGRKKDGKGKTATGAVGQGGGGGGTGPDHRGFTIDVPQGGGSGGGAKKSAAKKSASSSKKGKKKTGGVGGGAAGAKSNKGSAKASGGKGQQVVGGGGGDDEDDDLLFLDAQIKQERAAEPCYASLLRSTTEAMRANNPRWAAAEDKGKPSRSVITGARRTQLKGALETKLTEKEKKRSKSSVDEGKKS